MQSDEGRREREGGGRECCWSNFNSEGREEMLLVKFSWQGREGVDEQPLVQCA